MEKITQKQRDEVWQAVWKGTQEGLRNPKVKVHPAYGQKLKELNFAPDKFPPFESINFVLNKIGWTMKQVEELSSIRDFAKYILNKTFPVTSHIRNLNEAAYSATPDAIHDLLGHLPMLLDEEYRKYLEDLSKAILSTDSPDLQRSLARLFLWTVKYGMVCGRGGPQIIGGALLASPQELNAVFGGMELMPFSHTASETDINFVGPQMRLFVAGSIGHYQDVLKKICANKYPIIANSLTKYSEFVESPDDYPHFKEGMNWIESFIAQPNEKLQRAGHVCPFVRPAMDQELFNMVSMESGTGTAQDAYKIGKNLIDLFKDLYPNEELRSRGALVAFFPHLDKEQAADFIDFGHRSLRMEFIKNGLMIGEFHKNSQVGSVRNAELHVMKSPVPMFAVRALSHHDTKFLDRPEFSVDERRQFFEYYLKFLSPTLGPDSVLKVRKIISDLEGRSDKFNQQI